MWNSEQITDQLAVINGQKAPDIVIQNAVYLHSILKKWVEGNIWISGDRIVYAGEKMPPEMEEAEIVDASNKKIVPGYIEAHVHPFQLYNPETFAYYAAKRGTTAFISDNLILHTQLDERTADRFIEQLNELPFSFYWWARLDSQTYLQNEKELFEPQAVSRWLKRSDVLLAGELTGWPKLLAGDRNMMQSMGDAKQGRTKIEGHLPGASERTLARMKLLGIDGDHEAMTADEVERRLLQGYAVTLRQSSIRPDLRVLLEGIIEKELDVFDHLMMTTDGATPSFYRAGVMDQCIQIALDAGVPAIDAYLMASYNAAKYYNMTDVHSVIATGRFATLNFLEDENNPVPTDVLSKGKWILRDQQPAEPFQAVDWELFEPFHLPFELKGEDFAFPSENGIQMVNDVITKPYKSSADLADGNLAGDECFLMLISKEGSWRVNTVLKGFADNLQGFASSYSNTGDIILIGQNQREMKRAFDELKRIGGGMVIAENGKIAETLPLAILGGVSNMPMEEIMEKEIELKEALEARGYSHGDAVYTLLFLMSVHLPYVRITPEGLVNVMKNECLIPYTERQEII